MKEKYGKERRVKGVNNMDNMNDGMDEGRKEGKVRHGNTPKPF